MTFRLLDFKHFSVCDLREDLGLLGWMNLSGTTPTDQTDFPVNFSSHVQATRYRQNYSPVAQDKGLIYLKSDSKITFFNPF